MFFLQVNAFNSWSHSSKQKHLEEFPAGLPHDELKLMKKRRKQTLQTLDSMSVLDIAQGLKDKEEKKSKKRKGSFDGSEEESD